VAKTLKQSCCKRTWRLKIELNLIKLKRKTEMKALRALMLVLALSVCTYAGNMGSGVVDPPPTPPSSATTAPGANTDDSTGQMEKDAASTDSFTEITLNLLQSVLSLI
jgi:hypothetical protein